MRVTTGGCAAAEQRRRACRRGAPSPASAGPAGRRRRCRRPRRRRARARRARSPARAGQSRRSRAASAATTARHARGGQRLQPDRARVGPGPQAVQHAPPASTRTRPSAPPARRAGPSRARSRLVTIRAIEQVEGQRAEARATAGGSATRSGTTASSTRRCANGIEHRGEDVRGQQHDDEQRDVAVQAVDDEARACAAPGRQRSVPLMPRTHRRREQDERDRAGAAAQVPQRARAGGGEDHAATGQAPTVTTAPVRVDEPRGQAERLEPPRRGRSAHDRGGARRVGVHARGGGDADGPPHRRGRLAGGGVDDVVDGRARRAATGAPSVLDVARPPPRTVTLLAVGVGAGAVVVGHADEPAAGRDGPGGRHVAAEVDERRRPGRRRDGRRGAVGGQGLGRRAEIEAAPRARAAAAGARASSVTVRQPGRRARRARRRPRRPAPPRSRGRSPGRRAPARRWGRRRPPVCSAARSAAPTACGEQPADRRVTRPPASLARISSESARKRLHARSMASSSATSRRSASRTRGLLDDHDRGGADGLQRGRRRTRCS